MEAITSTETLHQLHNTARCKNPEDHHYKTLLVRHINPKLVETKRRKGSCVKNLRIVEEQFKRCKNASSGSEWLGVITGRLDKTVHSLHVTEHGHNVLTELFK